VSSPESFIDEVTEEVRRDKLFAAIKKYGWIGVVAVLAIVGGTAWTEWSKAQERAAAEAAGDAVLAALDQTDPAAQMKALQAIPAEGDRAALMALIEAAQETDSKAAADKLAAIAGNSAYPQLYRDLATLKRCMLPGAPVPADERAKVLEPLTAPGAPFRVLAEEQMALAELAQGDRDAALKRLQALLTDTEASGPLRKRATQLIVALGATPGGA
jgi:hypothetical protein